MSGTYPFSESMGWKDTTPGILFCSAALRKCSSFDGVLKTAGEVLMGGWLVSCGVLDQGWMAQARHCLDT